MIDAPAAPLRSLAFFPLPRPEVALEIAELPIQTTARLQLHTWAAEVLVSCIRLHRLPMKTHMKAQVFWLAEEAKKGPARRDQP